MSIAAGKRQVSTHLPVDLVAELDAMADASGISRSLLVEHAIELWIAKQKSATKRRTRR